MDRSARSGRTLALTIGAPAVTLAFAAASTLGSPLEGTFALLGGKAAVTAQMRESPAAQGKTTLDVTQAPIAGGASIRSYDVDMTKLMHLVVVSDDFTQFQHVHPDFDSKTGDFRITLSLDKNRRYYAYADTDPHGIGQQVFRFTVQPGVTAAAPSAMPAGTPSPQNAQAGPYRVHLGSLSPAAGKPFTTTIDITRDGKPAGGLQPYLGAAAHAVFIDMETLQYVHVHPSVRGRRFPMAMSGMPGMPGMNMVAGNAVAGPKLSMYVPPLPVGSYKLWLQFQGGNTVYTAPFTLVAK